MASNIIEEIEEEIVRVISEVQTVKAVYTDPIFSPGRTLPALLVLYAGFKQQPFTQTSFAVQFDFECTLYMPLEGRDPAKPWAVIKQISLDILKAFRDNWRLNGVTLWSLVDEGKPIVDIPKDPNAKPKWVGHTFSLLTKVQQSEEA